VHTQQPLGNVHHATCAGVRTGVGYVRKGVHVAKGERSLPSGKPKVEHILLDHLCDSLPEPRAVLLLGDGRTTGRSTPRRHARQSASRTAAPPPCTNHAPRLTPSIHRLGHTRCGTRQAALTTRADAEPCHLPLPSPLPAPSPKLLTHRIHPRPSLIASSLYGSAPVPARVVLHAPILN
jgi:hypothetical protein